MNKKISSLILVIILALVLALPVSAKAPLLVDDAALVSDATAVTQALENVSNKHALDVVVVTVDSTGEYTDMEYADDYFDYNGYGQGDERDGVLLLINMETSKAWISTSGYGITAFTDAGIEYIGTVLSEKLGDGDFDGAFIEFAELADDFITQAKNGTPYDTDNLPKFPFDTAKALIIGLGIGFVAALIVTSGMKSKLKSVRKQSAAANYERHGSLQLVNSNEYFLFSHVDSVKKEEKSSGGSSTHTSSSGNTHGGGGFSF